MVGRARLAQFGTDFHAFKGEMCEFRTEVRERFLGVDQRLDSLHQRVDTVVDSIADLRQDFATHSHDG